jgi:hypothetical protein
MIFDRTRLVPSLLTCLLATGTGAAEPTVAELRDRVVKADTAEKKAEAYKAFFLKVGRAGLKDLMKDDDTGIALQAAWETYAKPIKRRPAVGARADDVYDPAELKKFVAVLKERTKAPVPDGWAAAMTDVDLFSGAHHAFIGPLVDETDTPTEPRTGRGDLKAELNGDNIVCSAGGRSVAFPKDTFGGILTESFVGSVGEKRSVIAAYTKASGFAYQVAGFEGEGGKPVWKAEVWAAGRDFLGGRGYHAVDFVETDGVAYLFGMESHGAYAEAFDVATGKVKFRFCTCYWWHWSEAWGLK